jgi:hypothetical protein
MKLANLLHAAKQVLILGQKLRPEVIALVNEVRLVAHNAGQLGDHESDFQKYAGKHTEILSILTALPPPTDENGLRLDGPTLEEYLAAGYSEEAYPPAGYAVRLAPEVPPAPVLTPSTDAEKVEYEAGVSLARAGVPIPDTATPMARAGYNAFKADPAEFAPAVPPAEVPPAPVSEPTGPTETNPPTPTDEPAKNEAPTEAVA